MREGADVGFMRKRPRTRSGRLDATITARYPPRELPAM